MYSRESEGAPERGGEGLDIGREEGGGLDIGERRVGGWTQGGGWT